MDSTKTEDKDITLFSYRVTLKEDEGINDTVYTMAIKNGKSVGLIEYQVGYKTSIWGSVIHVGEKHRGSGVARMLIKSVFDYAKENSFESVSFKVNKANEDVVKMYRFLGCFVSIEYEKSYYMTKRI